MAVRCMPSWGTGATYLLERARVWHDRHAHGPTRAERDVQVLSCGECDVVLREVPRCDGDLQLGALYGRQLGSNTQALV